MSRIMGQTLPPITDGLSRATSPMWQALLRRKGRQPLYLLACLQSGDCPDVRLLPPTPSMRIARAVLQRAQAARPGTYTGAVTLYQRMWGACKASGRTVMTRPEVFAMLARECSEKAILKVLRTLVASSLVEHMREHAVHWYRPVTLEADSQPAVDDGKINYSP